MKNLKRVLSLGLASVMLVGMMVVGASAKDFTDAADIEHAEAVDTMVALNIIAGKEDGSYFDPKGDVTRGEMAKMISVMMNGGNDVNTGVKGNPTFTDIKGHWAEPYIEYCADMGYISGRGDGTFDPDGKVTATEAAKMVLTAMGYDAKAYHLEGASWASQTLERARTTEGCKLVEELGDVVFSEAATRDTAAQLIWNGLQAYVVTNSPDQNLSNGEITWKYATDGHTTLLEQRYDAFVLRARYEGNHNYCDITTPAQGEIAVTALENKWVKSTTYTESGADIKGEVTSGTPRAGSTFNFPSDMSIDNIGEEVKIVWKNGTRSNSVGPDKNDTIYGVFNTGATRVVRSTLGKIGDQKSSKAQINIDGTLYDVVEDSGNPVHGNVTVIVNYNNRAGLAKRQAENGHTVEEAGTADNSDLTKLLKKNSGASFKALFDEYGKINKIYVTESYLAAVTGVNSTNINIDNGVGNLKFDDHDIEDGLERGDVVVVTPLYDTSYGTSKMVVTVKKAEKVSGELTAYKSNNDNQANPEDESLTIDGETYKVAYKNVDGGKLNVNFNSRAALRNTDIPEEDGDVISQFYAVLRDNDYIGEDFDLYLVDGYVAAAVQTSESAKNYSLVTEVKDGSSAGGTFGQLQLQVMGADGTKEVITVSEDSKVWDKDNNKSLTHNTSRTKDDTISQLDYRVGDIVTYTFNDDDEAEVTIRSLVTDSNINTTANAVSYDEKAKSVTFTLQNGSTTTIPTAGDAIFFANTKASASWENTNNHYKLVNAKWEAFNIRDLDEIASAASQDVTVALNNDGDRVVAVYVNLGKSPDGAGDEDVYGIISSYNGRVKDYYVYTVQANGEEYTVNYKGDASDDLVKGDLVKFNPTNDNNYNKEKVVKVKSLPNTDYRNLHWFDGYASELKDDVLVYYQTVNQATSNDPFLAVKSSNKSYALDKDCKIVYVDQDGDKSIAEGSVTEFSSITGKKNIGFVLKETTNDNGNTRYVIVALFVETSNKVDIGDI